MKRPIRIEGDIAYIPLTKGYEAVIDVADVPMVDGHNWCAFVRHKADGSVRTVYAVRGVGPRGASRIILMHRVIAGTPDGIETDHRDGNGLNNRRHNLREASASQNGQNQRISIANTSGVKGVNWHKKTGKWRAEIKLNGKQRHIGLFANLQDAADAYAKASTELHGEFGRVA